LTKQSALKVRLWQGGNEVAAQILRPMALEHVRAIQETWPPGLPGEEDEAWEWSSIRTEHPDGDGWQQFVPVYDNRVQGAMVVREKWTEQMRSPGNIGFEGSYIEYLAAAPWNRKNAQDQRIDTRFEPVTPVGKVLLACALNVSKELGMEGRIGWHSLMKATSWYERTLPGLWCGGPDLDEAGLPYYELDAAAAALFLDTNRQHFS
jgi:hypothetical protein